MQITRLGRKTVRRRTRGRGLGVAVLLVLPLLGLGHCVGQEPAAPAASGEAGRFDAVAKDIEKLVLALGYPKETADALTRLAGGWKCDLWKQQIEQARSTGAAELARAEEAAAKTLFGTIEKEIPYDQGSQYFYLAKVVSDKKANSLGYCQLFYVLGNSIGLKAAVVNVLELASGPPPVGKTHVACSVSLADGTLLMMGISEKVMAKPFVFKDLYGQAGYYWELKQNDNPAGFPKRIQFLNERGLVGVIYDSLAVEYEKAGQFGQAIAFCNNAIALNPTYAEAYVTRGIAYGKSRQSAKALFDFGKAIELNPRCADAYSNRGAHYDDLGRYKEAIPDCTKAIELNPKYALPYCKRGIAYSELGQSNEAVADLSMAIKLSPRYVDAFVGRGAAYDLLGRYAEAIADYSKAVELNPQMAIAYLNRGMAHGKASQPAEAIADFNKAIELAPQMAEAFMMRGIAHAALLGKPEEAKADLRKAMELNPNLKAEVKKVSDEYKLGL